MSFVLVQILTLFLSFRTLWPTLDCAARAGETWNGKKKVQKRMMHLFACHRLLADPTFGPQADSRQTPGRPKTDQILTLFLSFRTLWPTLDCAARAGETWNGKKKFKRGWCICLRVTDDQSQTAAAMLEQQQLCYSVAASYARAAADLLILLITGILW